ncbi:MAG: GSCFA domain-containing protein [Rikenellaceae bacterium]|jgi:hypothetical protein|nr:GSCFA domain-containing protein [Rikenellaceae bacterium]
MLRFRTEITPGPLGFEIDHRTRLMSVGSCFAENMARRMERAKFHVKANPFGVVFNPLSVASCLSRLLDGAPFTEADLSRDGERWFSYDCHGSFSSACAEGTLAAMNRALEEGSRALQGAEVVIVTLGTAWAYERRGRVVANCHKMPASEFTRRRLSADETAASLEKAIGRMSGKRFILTVSPVRHLRDSLAENSLSKATLTVAAHALAGKYENVSYFPAYEILVDDLRDYRFYAEDMCHPTQQAVDYVWEKFCAAAMSPATAALAVDVERIAAAVAHRPLNREGRGYEAFARGMLERIAALAAAHPEIDLTQETEYFTK